MLTKADRLDGKGSVKGYYVYVPAHSDEWGTYGELHMLIENSIEQNNYKINPQTLKYSFDNGENWFSESKIEDVLNRR